MCCLLVPAFGEGLALEPYCFDLHLYKPSKAEVALFGGSSAAGNE